MKLSKLTKAALDRIAEDAALTWKEVADECYDPADSEGEPYSKEEFMRDDWLDNGYEFLDEVSSCLDKTVVKLLKKGK